MDASGGSSHWSDARIVLTTLGACLLLGAAIIGAAYLHDHTPWPVRVLTAFGFCGLLLGICFVFVRREWEDE